MIRPPIVAAHAQGSRITDVDGNTFLDFVGAFVREHPSRRVTTELLFMLDELAQASRDALLMLLSSDPHAVLGDTLEADADAFLLAESLYRQYGDWTRREGLRHTDAIRARIAVELGRPVDEVFAEVLPEDKVAVVRRLQEEGQDHGHAQSHAGVVEHREQHGHRRERHEVRRDEQREAREQKRPDDHGEQQIQVAGVRESRADEAVDV